MTTKQLLEDVAREFCVSEKTIEQAHQYAKMCNPAKEVEEAINKELPPEMAALLKAYLVSVINGSKNPELRKQFLAFYKRTNGNRN